MKLDLSFEQNQQNINIPFSESGGQFNANFGETSVLHDGQNGATFIPSVSAEGVISWINDRELPNPPPVNIKGEKGDKGEQGESGVYVGSGDLPEASETMRGSFAIVPNGDTDNLYICMRVAGVYGWVVLNASGTSDGGAEEDITTTSVLGLAMLGTMILGG